MIDPVPIELNLNNLEDIFQRIAHLEAFIFFGTLLGYTREGNIILGDDDIDIYVNIKQLDKLIEALIDSDYDIKILPRYRWYHIEKQPLFVQASRMQEGIQTYVDFYLYDDEAPNFLKEKWNFKGAWKNPKSALHIAKHLIFPIQDAEMQGIKIKIPAFPDQLCAFLYGADWNIPRKKGKDYVMEIVKHEPVYKSASLDFNILQLVLLKIRRLIERIYYYI